MSDEKPEAQGTAPADEEADREAILARRRSWVSGAVASAGVAVLGGLALAQPCLSRVRPPEPARDGGQPEAGPRPDASAGAPRACLSTSRPHPCLRPVNPHPCLDMPYPDKPAETESPEEPVEAQSDSGPVRPSPPSPCLTPMPTPPPDAGAPRPCLRYAR